MSACSDFSARLLAALEGRASRAGLTRLGWHEHLLSCSRCRDLLEREEALELILSDQPDPVLPPDLARRVVRVLRARLASDPEQDLQEQPVSLENLLDLDAVRAPDGLAGDVLARLAGARGLAEETGEERAALERLLERNVVDVPANLSASVLAGLAGQRDSGSLRPASSRQASSWTLRASWTRLAAAAVLVFVLGGWFVSRMLRGPGGEQVAEGPPVLVEGSQDIELLASLELLENWELIESLAEDLDIVATIGDEAELLSWETGMFAETLDEDEGEAR